MTSPWYMYGDFNAALDPAEDIYEGYEVGDIVSLIVGGPDMVVLSVCDECDEVYVAWIKADGDVMVDGFPAEVLIYA